MSTKEGEYVPLTQKVSFKTPLQRGNRVQVPKLVRWQFKMETEQILKVTVSAFNVWGSSQTFYAKMGKDGRILLPKLQLELMQNQRETNLIGYVIEVTLEPT
jgi:DNA-binding transcriptional regulator/RsmH inhibitor MraZ